VFAPLGAFTAKCVAALVTTSTEPDVAFNDAVVTSVAVIVWLPTLLKVTLQELTPLAIVRVEEGWKEAWASLLTSCTVPA
jgi:hypothetical protein